MNESRSTRPQVPGRKAVPSTNVIYSPGKGVDDFVMNVHAADPMRLIETERKGVAGVFVKDLARLPGIAKDIVDNSTAPDAKGFDSAKWLGQWLETSQPAELIEQIPGAHRCPGPPLGGQDWLRGTTAAILEMPSVIVLEESTALVNPLHPGAKSLSATIIRPFDSA